MTLGGILLGLGLLASLAWLGLELRRARMPDPRYLRRIAPELHVVAALLSGVGAGIAWGWPWGLGAGLAQAVAAVALAAWIDR